MKLFLDYFSVYSNMETHLRKLCLVFEKCRQYGVSLNPQKCILMVPTGVILGYIVGKEGKFPDPKKIQALVDMPTSKTIEAIQEFNNLAIFNHYFFKNYAAIMEPITRLTRNNEPFISSI